jgi:hypothetical protein
MPVITNSQSVAAGASVANVFSGSAFEFARSPSLISIGITASATGAFVTIQNGSDIVAEEFPPYVSATYPIIPDQMYFSDVANTGDRLVVRVRNPTGGAITFNSIAQISFLS